MSTYTTNYNLEKPDSGDDFKDFRSNYNSNMDIIDANLGGGGGGNVDDVLVNGVSVVDGNHDAQITSYKEVTQAEYDALPATKLTDGIAYFIKDAGGGGGGSSSHDYSTTEQVIGTWIDGKPVYEKTLEVNNIDMGNVNGTKTTIPHGISNFKDLIDLRMNCPKLGVSSKDELFDGNNGNAIAHFRVNATNVYCQAGSAWYSGSADRYWYIILQYTKTTDV